MISPSAWYDLCWQEVALLVDTIATLLAPDGVMLLAYEQAR